METYSQIGQDLFVTALFNNKRNGTFLDVGCSRPTWINNTYLLEKNYGWDGVSLDIESYNDEWKARSTKFISCNALLCDYNEVLSGFPYTIDYLSLDIEGSGDRFRALLKVFESSHEFKIITIEHDAYRGYEQTEKEPQRKFLKENNYVLLFSDVSNGTPFEDWWINPKYFNYTETIANNEYYKDTLKRFGIFLD